MDGTPVRTSARKRTKRPNPAVGNSFTKTAAPRPIGTAIAAAQSTTIALPMSALRMPPPFSPGGSIHCAADERVEDAAAVFAWRQRQRSEELPIHSRSAVIEDISQDRHEKEDRHARAQEHTADREALGYLASDKAPARDSCVHVAHSKIATFPFDRRQMRSCARRLIQIVMPNRTSPT